MIVVLVAVVVFVALVLVEVLSAKEEYRREKQDLGRLAPQLREKELNTKRKEIATSVAIKIVVMLSPLIVLAVARTVPRIIIHWLQ